MKRDSLESVHLEKLEESLWRESTRFDRSYMDALLAPDFFEIGMSGKSYQRDEALNVSPQSINAQFPLQELQTKFLAPDIALLSYISTDHFLNTVRRARRTSIWSRATDGRWLLRFHQGTPIDR